MNWKEFKEAINKIHFEDNQEVEFDEYGSVTFTLDDPQSDYHGEKLSLKEIIL